MQIPNQTDLSTLKIYTSDSGGVKVFETGGEARVEGCRPPSQPRRCNFRRATRQLTSLGLPPGVRQSPPSTGQQASAPATETPAAAGIVVPPRQVLGEYNEAGIFASIEGSAPAVGDVEGADTVVKVAAQSTSTGAQPPTDSTYLHAPWSTKSGV